MVIATTISKGESIKIIQDESDPIEFDHSRYLSGVEVLEPLLQKHHGWSLLRVCVKTGAQPIAEANYCSLVIEIF